MLSNDVMDDFIADAAWRVSRKGGGVILSSRREARSGALVVRAQSVVDCDFDIAASRLVMHDDDAFASAMERIDPTCVECRVVRLLSGGDEEAMQTFPSTALKWTRHRAPAMVAERDFLYRETAAVVRDRRQRRLFVATASDASQEDLESEEGVPLPVVAGCVRGSLGASSSGIYCRELAPGRLELGVVLRADNNFIGGWAGRVRGVNDAIASWRAEAVAVRLAAWLRLTTPRVAVPLRRSIHVRIPLPVLSDADVVVGPWGFAQLLRMAAAGTGAGPSSGQPPQVGATLLARLTYARFFMRVRLVTHAASRHSRLADAGGVSVVLALGVDSLPGLFDAVRRGSSRGVLRALCAEHLLPRLRQAHAHVASRMAEHHAVHGGNLLSSSSAERSARGGGASEEDAMLTELVGESVGVSGDNQLSIRGEAAALLHPNVVGMKLQLAIFEPSDAERVVHATWSNAIELAVRIYPALTPSLRRALPVLQTSSFATLRREFDEAHPALVTHGTASTTPASSSSSWDLVSRGGSSSLEGSALMVDLERRGASLLPCEVRLIFACYFGLGPSFVGDGWIYRSAVDESEVQGTTIHRRVAKEYLVSLDQGSLDDPAAWTSVAFCDLQPPSPHDMTTTLSAGDVAAASSAGSTQRAAGGAGAAAGGQNGNSGRGLVSIMATAGIVAAAIGVGVVAAAAAGKLSQQKRSSSASSSEQEVPSR